MDWHEDGSISFQANNGKFLGIKRSGHLYANVDSAATDNAKFFFYLINRPVLVLKCDQGFVDFKSKTSDKMECNKATYETIRVERGEKGAVHLKAQKGKYLSAESSSDLSAVDAGDAPQAFFFELRDPSRMCIKNDQGRYLNSEKNGGIGLGSTDPEAATQWEY